LVEAVELLGLGGDDAMVRQRSEQEDCERETADKWTDGGKRVEEADKASGEGRGHGGGGAVRGAEKVKRQEITALNAYQAGDKVVPDYRGWYKEAQRVRAGGCLRW
jgi:Ni/Co efflux regulator RcnB